jgi:DNA polymerase-3 subunit delta'
MTMQAADFLRPLPWLELPWQTLMEAIDQDRVAHALLIRGVAGIGKTRLATDYARRLLCQKPQAGKACGQCTSCHLFDAGTHPDFLMLAPEEAGKAIKVDAIRQMTQEIALTPQYAGYRVVIIDQADALNGNAANALLKSLEEPPNGTVIVLVTDRPQQLPATVRSRCRNLSIGPIHSDMALQWLNQQGFVEDAPALLSTAAGSPLRAASLEGSEAVKKRIERFDELMAVFFGARDPLDVAEIWSTKLVDMELLWMASWLADGARLGLTEGRVPARNIDLDAQLRRLAARIPVSFLMETYDRILKCQEALRGPANRQLVFEEFLIRWAEGGARPQ